MNKKKLLALGPLGAIVLPLLVYFGASRIKLHFRPTNMVYVTPSEYEAAFNVQMAAQGMTLRLDNANWRAGTNTVVKTVRVDCADGSDLTCTMYASSERDKAYVQRIRFDQQATGGDPVHLTALLEQLLTVFTPSLVNQQTEKTFPDTCSWEEAVQRTSAFSDGPAESDQLEVCCFENSSAIPQLLFLERRPSPPGETLSLQLNVHIARAW